MAFVSNFEENLISSVQAAVSRRIQEVVEAEVKEAQSRIARQVPEIVAGLALKIHSHVSVERLGTDIRIVLQMKELGK